MINYRSIYKSNRGIRKLFSDIIFIIILSAVITGGALWALKYQFIIVEGTSSEPKIPLYSVIAIKDATVDTVEVNDYITWQRQENGAYVTHKIYLKDANTVTTTQRGIFVSDDAPAHKNINIVGRVDVIIPYVGWARYYLTYETIPSILCIIGIILAGKAFKTDETYIPEATSEFNTFKKISY